MLPSWRERVFRDKRNVGYAITYQIIGRTSNIEIRLEVDDMIVHAGAEGIVHTVTVFIFDLAAVGGVESSEDVARSTNFDFECAIEVENVVNRVILSR